MWHATQKITHGIILEDYEIRSLKKKKKKIDILSLISFLKKKKMKGLLYFLINLYCIFHIVPSHFKSNNIYFILYKYMQCAFVV